MENHQQPLISPRLQPIPENLNSSSVVTIPRSISTTSFFHEIVPHHEDETDPDFYFTNTPRPLHRSRTGPAMVIIKDLTTTKNSSPISKSISITTQAILLVIIYLTIGVSIYFFTRSQYSGVKTHPLVDALYFCIVTMCTIGYGDISPLTPLTKIFSLVFVFFGFLVLYIFYTGVFSHVFDSQEMLILVRARKEYLIDFEKGRMKTEFRVGLALCFVVLCIGVGALVLYFVEGSGFVDSVYVSFMSVTTVGYGGDGAFKTLEGRLFAVVWLLLSTLAVVRVFLLLAELRMDRWNRRAVKSALNREITVEDLLAADTNQHGFISKAEYIVMKLKEMGKIRDIDINQVVNQFDKLDPNNLGKITLPNLL
ncbi:hypothetical protein AALP_AA2G008500 [Arabis alpina]|uniref:Potassium channel domain-containing protein n=1 Tax=Arabis alpina TaxID=50452 RepID=A0A087HEI4_ARAAL|nr:hypothetical protein AALP_AA2G008500 [Arabis alpina]